MQWGKQNISNALNSTNIFAVCHGGSIWSMIDFKGCLRISWHKLVWLCELTLLFITALAPIDLLGYFKSGFGLGLRSPERCCDSSYSPAAMMTEQARDIVSRGEINLYIKYWSQIIGHFLNNKSVAHPLVIIYNFFFFYKCKYVRNNASDPHSDFMLCIYPFKVNTHSEQWTVIYSAAPGEKFGVRCLAQGHLSRGIRGGERAVHSPPPPPTIPAGPRLKLTTFRIRVRLSNH